MTNNIRVFEAGQLYSLCSFEVLEGEDWAPPNGTQVLHVEPIISDPTEGSPGGVVEGLYLWALVPSNKMVDLAKEHQDG